MRIEFILRESTIKDVIKPWVDSGNVDNSNDGGFVFENAEDYEYTDSDCIRVVSNGADYIYNVSDFYRIKIS